MNVLPASWDWYLCHIWSPRMRGRFTLEAFAIVIWSLAFVLFLVALALPCTLCRRDIRAEPPVAINVLPAS
jgi:hypothetical protein